MATAPVQETPPAAPVAPSTPSPAAVPEIQVSSMKPVNPATPPKKGSARAAMFERLEKKFGGETPDTPAAPAAKPDAPKPAAQTPETPETPAETPNQVPETPATPDDPKKGKVSPWKLLDEERAARKKAEEARAEIEKRAIPEADWKAKQETLTKLEQRNKELEDEIRYVNYQKSEEFKQKYEKPYQDAWSRAMGELKELVVDDPATGNQRAFKAQDILDLVNLPLQQARALAVERYGDFADDVMQHRKEIRRLYDEQSNALEEVRKQGGEREKKRLEEQQAQYGQVTTEIKQTWAAANETATKHEKYGKFFTPVEGDTEGNQRLAKGFELADRAFSENPLAPGLKPEERKAIVERHAVVRNRCAAFGRLVYQLDKSTQRAAELEKELASYKGATPETRGANGEQTAPKPSSAREGMMERLRKRAVPVS